MGVETPSATHVDQAVHWQLIDDLMGGTLTMRNAGKRYLPQQRFERDEDYEVRRTTATLYPAFTETLGSMAGRIFASPPVMAEIPDWVKKEVFTDTNRQRLPFEMFLPLWFKSGLAKGMSFVLVDSPAFDGVPSVNDQLTKRLHPYYVLVDANQILDHDLDDDGLREVRILFIERKKDPTDRWKTLETKTVRVYTREANSVTVTVYTPNEKQEYIPGPTRVMGGLKEIPLVPFYTGFVAPFKSVPPLRELAYLNAKHYVQQSTYDALVVLAMIPILTLIGGEENAELKIGSRQAVRIANPEGDLKYTEHTGAAMRTGRESLDKIKEEMKESGAKLLLPAASNANKTATQASEEAQRENSPAQVMVTDFESAVKQLIRVTELWRSSVATETVTFSLRPNLKPDFTPADTAKILVELQDRNLISRETLHGELQRRDVLQATITWKDEQERIAADPKGYLIAAAESKGQLAVDQNTQQ